MYNDDDDDDDDDADADADDDDDDDDFEDEDDVTSGAVSIFQGTRASQIMIHFAWIHQLEILVWRGLW